MPIRAAPRPCYRTSALRSPAAGPAGITLADLALRRDLQRHLRHLRAEHRRLLRAIAELHRTELGPRDLASSGELRPLVNGARRVPPS